MGTGGCSVRKSTMNNSSDLVNKTVMNKVDSDIHDRDHCVATDLLRDKSKAITTTSTIIQSDTSIFQSLDGYEANRQCGIAKEELKDINSTSIDPYTINNNTTTSCQENCFGKSFFCT